MRTCLLIHVLLRKYLAHASLYNHFLVISGNSKEKNTFYAILHKIN